MSRTTAARLVTRCFVAATLGAALTAAALAQDPASAGELASILNFETEHAGGVPRGWTGAPPGTFALDGEHVHGGRWAVRLDRPGAATGGQTSTSLMGAIPVDFGGTTLEWRGFLRSENVSGFMGLWLRQDGDTPGLAFVSMQPRQIKGTNDWAEYSVELPLHREAKRLTFAVILGGSGRVWADDLQLRVDGRPVWDAPKVERPKTPIELDTQFDSGSGITISELSRTQVENLAVLGKAWGFLKYHHPVLTSGTRHWDYDLFRVLPSVLAARDRPGAERALLDWVQALGVPPVCERCSAPGNDEAHLRPDLAWIDAAGSLAAPLRAVHGGRSQGRQFYVALAPGVGNPLFNNEPAYPDVKLPDAGYQLLALYRFWNVIQYWFPYRDLLDESWEAVLAEFIPRIALAKDGPAYQLELLALIAKVTDAHANLSVSPGIRPPAGTCQLPVTARFIEGVAVVTAYSNVTTGPATGLQVGDVIETLDGVPVADLIERWQPYYPASNRPGRLRDMASGLTRGACGEVRLGVRRPDGVAQITSFRQPLAGQNLQASAVHDQPGDPFRLLSEQVAYLKLSSVQALQAPSYVERAKGTRGLIVDIRNYPSEFVVFALGSLLVDRPTPFVRFTTGDLENPGAFKWASSLLLTPQQPHYAGTVVVLVDEVSLSQAEYTAMAFRAAPNAVVVGSTTAGADGNVSPIMLPGGLRTAISGIGVFYPDKRPTQRIGIVPDVTVLPTIAGIRAGRDEVLEEGLRQILGADVPTEQIRKMAAPSR